MSEGGSESELEYYSRKNNSTMHSTQTQTAPQHIIPPVLASRRQRPASLMPTAPPPAQALPPTPAIAQSYPTQSLSSRLQNPAPSYAVQAHSPPVGYAQQNNVYSHPYSPHPYASNVNPQQHPPRDTNGTAYRATSYRQSLQQPYQSSRQPTLTNHRQSQSPSPSSSASNSSILSASVGLGIFLPSSTSNSYSDQPLSSPYSELSPRRLRESRVGPMSSVPAGSYFAAYPSSSSRDRSDSATSNSSLGGPRPMTASTANLHSSRAASPSLHSVSNYLQSSDSISHPSPTPPNSSSSAQAGRSQRPSSRRALTAALELAKAAVQLDATNEDPHGAVVAYARSVQLLGEVMERVMRGEDASGSGHTGATDGEERRRGGRRRSVVAKEEEVRRLKAIHDTYADRMRILCLIYSIQDPLPASHQPRAPITSPTTATSASLSLQVLSSSTSVASTITGPEPSGGTQNGSNIIPTPRALEPASPSEEAYTPSVDQRTPGRNNDWEMVDSDRRRLGSDRENARVREREQPLRESTTDRVRETPFDVNEAIGNVMLSGTTSQPPQQPPPIRPTIQRSASNTSMTSGQEVRTPPSPYVPPSQAEAPVPVPGARTSMLPPPRPPPSMPLPNRPRGSSAAPAFPSQVLNQPLSRNNTPTIMEPTPITGLHAPSNGSNLPVSNSTLAPPIQAGITGAGVGRARGNSNAHRRTPSNSDRLGAVNEEQEEEISSTSVHAPVLPVPPPPPQGPKEGNYRSRSSSMVSVKDRERAKAQVQTAVQQTQPPLPVPSLAQLLQRELPSTPPSPTSTTSNGAVPIPPTPHRPSVDYYQQFTAGPTRGRGNSLGSNVTHSSEDLVTPETEHSPGATPVAHAIVGPDATKQAGGQIVGPGSNPQLDPQPVKISTTTTGGVISQRRQKNSETGAVSAASSTTDLNASTTRLTTQQLPPSTATSLGLTGRSRAVSNPGRRPTNLGVTEQPGRPPIPVPPLSAGLKRHFTGRFTPLMQTISSPVVPTVHHPFTGDAPTAGKPLSPPAPAPPREAVLRPYYLMFLLRKSMVDRTGGFITPKLHVPNEVWTQGGAKLQNHADKMKALDILASALDELSTASVEFCGAGGANGLSGALGRTEAERWASKLEDFDRSLSQVGEMYGKKLGVGEGFVAKKSGGMAALTGKFARGLDRMTTGKNYDSPASYVTMLIKFFGQAQVLDEHTKALISNPTGAAYAKLPPGVRTRMEMSLKNISDLFARVVLTFVFQDLSVLLVKYGKTCNQWLEGNT